MKKSSPDYSKKLYDLERAKRQEEQEATQGALKLLFWGLIGIPVIFATFVVSRVLGVLLLAAIGGHFFWKKNR